MTRHGKALAPEALAEVEDTWLTQRHSGDATSSLALLHDDYMGGNAQGIRLAKADFVRADAERKGGRYSTSHADRSMRELGDTVITTGVATVAAPNHEHRYRYLRVYLKTSDGLKLVASQSATVK
jgi:ketosteroid isomerase-like protein